MIVATRNKHKFSEIFAFLEGHSSLVPIQTFTRSIFKSSDGEHPQITSLLDHPNLPDIEEDCLSFIGNALKKAKVISMATDQPVLADDSGLMVDALDGRPGIFSARYAGLGSTDEQNNQKLLQELKALPANKRNARFVCAVVLYLPDGTFYSTTGELSGLMVDAYQGNHGFGYDPIFYMPDRKCTLAQVPETEKIKFSHRTRALENLLKITNHFKVLTSR